MRAVIAVLVLGVLAAMPARAQQTDDRLRDRGEGVPLSMFGTYLRSGELMIYPYFEYYRDSNYEYESGELGFGTDITELRSRYRASEGLVFVGYAWGTITARIAVANVAGKFEPGEYAVEYLRRVSSRRRVYAGIAGSEDEIEAITEAQVFLRPHIMLKLNNALGVTSTAPGWAPEIGMAFFFR